jgi:hypothetical protein
MCEPQIATPEQLLIAANQIIAEQSRALAQAYTALLHAREAVFWYHAAAFEKDGRPLVTVIDTAVDNIVRGFQ